MPNFDLAAGRRAAFSSSLEKWLFIQIISRFYGSGSLILDFARPEEDQLSLREIFSASNLRRKSAPSSRSRLTPLWRGSFFGVFVFLTLAKLLTARAGCLDFAAEIFEERRWTV
ncbi:MAG TPA: hypothetical protein VNN13_09475 [Methylomirabilota bacterium]|nr:hypothetical protein [Methylomirabilota bacterium]